MGWINTAPDLPLAGDRNGLVFDNTSYISTGYIHNYSTGISICMTIQTTSSVSGKTLYDDAGGTSSEYGTFIDTSSGKLRFYCAKGTSGTPNFSLTTNTAINNGQLHDIVCHWDGTTSTNGVKILIDGILDCQTTALSAIVNASYKSRISASGAGFPGLITNILVFNRAITSSEIVEIVNRQLFNDSGLQLYFKCMEGYGDILHDSSANNNAGTINGAKWIVPKNTNSVYELQFNGTSSYLDMVDSNSLHYPYNCTWTLDILPYTVTGNQMIITNSTNVYQQVGYVGLVVVDGKLGYYCLSGSWVYTTNIVITAGIKNRCVVVVGSSYVSFWVNGKFIETKSISYSSASINSVWSIGRNYSSGGAYVNGRLSNIKLYNRALTDTEIKAISNDMPHPTNGLVLDLPMDEGYGYGVVKDRSPYGNDGSINGASWVLGNRGGLKFDGVDDNVSANHTQQTTMPSQCTIEVKFKPYVVTGNPGVFEYRAADGVGLELYNSKFYSSGGLYSNTTAIANTDYFITIAWNGVTKYMYVNGALETSKAWINAFASNLIRLGISTGCTYLNGSISEARIWNRALSAAEIAMYKDVELTGNEPSLVFYWKGRATPDGKYAIDETINANHGTITGATPVAESAQTAKVITRKGLIM